MINLELYRIFFVVAENNNITKASKILNISQPAITKQIKNLEEQLNTPLFIRTTKGVMLNEYGEKIYMKVKKALTLLEEAENTIKSFSNIERGTLRIGASRTITKKYLLEYIEKFHKDYPNIIIDISTDPTKELVNKLKNGKIDLIIGKFPNTFDKELEYKELLKTKYIFISNNNHFKFKKETIQAKELENYPLLLQEEPSSTRRSIEKYFENNKINIKPKMNIATSSLLSDFIAIGFGIGYIPELFVKEEINNGTIKKINISPAPEEITIGVIKLKNNTLSNCYKKFINYLTQK